MRKKIYAMALLAILNSELFAKEGDTYLGAEWYGLSGKYDVNREVSTQVIVGLWGYSKLSVYTGRVNYKFKQDSHYNIYGYGGISSWYWRGDRSTGSESAFGLSTGGGIEYDIRGFDKDYIPLYVSVDLGVQVANFDDYDDLDPLAIGASLHFKF